MEGVIRIWLLFEITFTFIPVSTIERFQLFLEESPSRRVVKSQFSYKNNHTNEPIISYKLWDKNIICGRRFDIDTQEQEVCYMETKIALRMTPRPRSGDIDLDRHVSTSTPRLTPRLGLCQSRILESVKLSNVTDAFSNVETILS